MITAIKVNPKSDQPVIDRMSRMYAGGEQGWEVALFYGLVDDRKWGVLPMQAMYHPESGRSIVVPGAAVIRTQACSMRDGIERAMFVGGKQIKPWA